MWIPIRYRDFYDLPRAIVFTYGGRTLLLDCPFDAALDEYPSVFEVFELPADVELEGSWEALSDVGQHLGQVAASDLILDPTKRAFIDPSAIDPFFRGGAPEDLSPR